MFEFCAIVGYDIDKKPNLDLLLKNEYEPEILEIYPGHLKKSAMISHSVSQCFSQGQPSLYSHDNKLIYPTKLNSKDVGIQSSIHQFQVQLDDQIYKFCYVLSFYEQAYIQNIETLAGKRTKIITWSPQIDLSALINSKQVTAIKSTLLSNNATICIYVQKSIVIVSNQNETGCEATLINFINQQMSKDSNRSNYLNKQYIQTVSNSQQNIKLLNELLTINQELFQNIRRLPNFQLASLIDFLNIQHQAQKQLVISNSDFNENANIQNIPIMDFISHESTQDGHCNKISQELFHLQEMPKDVFYNPPDKIKLFRERVRKSNKKAKKPLIPIQPQYSMVKQNQQLLKAKPVVRPQEFSFHETTTSNVKPHRNQIFNSLNFPQTKTLLKL
ncbi:unnamed protein product [Paramecium sonneborni]|uniref:Uncharacterized protein n=1 Tax=Paramecium sonneborni TaxID=65129 RepID=A0A8S1QUA4_9CILI|nr:unnamed protein product [Paramecium sonneborni]